MAKKKTENIKAAPVLRAGSGGGGDQPVTPTITKSYEVRDDWKDKSITNYVAFKSVDGTVQDLTVNGEPAGGGGGVPIYHIEWTVVNGPITVDMNSTGLRKRLMWSLYQDGVYTLVDSNGVNLSDGASTMDVACFQPDGVWISLMDAGNITVDEGSATYDPEQGTVIVTGNCKLTLTVG